MFRQLHFKPQGISLYRLERRAIVTIAFATVATGIDYRLPSALVLVKERPRFRKPALANSRVVEPINLDCRDFRRLGEIVLYPFPGPLVRPPMQEAIGMVTGVLGLALVVERPHVGFHAVARGAGFAGRGDGRIRQWPGASLGVCQPDGHLATTAIGPGVIGNRREVDLVLF